MPWYRQLQVGAFVDAYYSANWRFPRPHKDAQTLRAFDQHEGFSVAFVGVDMSVEPEPVGFVAQIRLGSAQSNLAVYDNNVPGGLAYLQQAYGAYRPGGKDGAITLYLGKFDTLYGAETAASYLNINYTRGVLYNLAQPFFHTGFRADVQLSTHLALRAIAVNGWNNSVDNNRGKSGGVQLFYKKPDALTLALGYLGGPEQDDTSDPYRLGTMAPTGARGAAKPRHLVDGVAELTPVPSLRFLFNATAVTEDNAALGKRASWYGASLAIRVALSEVFAVAGRGEYLRDDQGVTTGVVAFRGTDVRVGTGTLTLEAIPDPRLVVRLENRVDASNHALFHRGLTGSTTVQPTTIVGIVAKTN